MNKSLTVFKICLYSILFVYFISCGRKIEQDTPKALVISKCSDVIVRSDCDGRKIGAQDCQWNANDGKCEDKTPAENENNPPVDPPTDEEPVAEENNPPAVEEPIVNENENENNPPAAPLANEEPAAVADENKPAGPTECSDYSLANNNLQQCGLRKIPGKLCNVQRPKEGALFEGVKVNNCEDIKGTANKAMLRCKAQHCVWRKEKSIFGKIKENSKESCHTTDKGKPKNK